MKPWGMYTWKWLAFSMMGRPSTPTLGRAGHWKSGGGTPSGPGGGPPGVPGGPIGPGGAGGSGGGGPLGGIGCRIGGCAESKQTVHCNYHTHNCDKDKPSYMAYNSTWQKKMSRNMSPLWTWIHYEYQMHYEEKGNITWHSSEAIATSWDWNHKGTWKFHYITRRHLKWNNDFTM